jgi:trimeric autotransporter adhesin
MRRPALVLLGFLVLCAATATKAQTPNTIVTVAGGGTNPTAATSAFLPMPRAAVRDAQGNTYISVPGLSIVYKVDTTGTMTAYAGNGILGFSGDGGPATQAELAAPEGLAIDAKGVLFIADTLNNRIRKVDTSGNITTVAGSEDPGSPAFGGDKGLATSARLAFPSGVAVDQNEDLFIADTSNALVRRVDGITQIITTYAGSQSAARGCPSGAATAAGFAQPVGVAVDTSGNVFIADATLDIVCKVDATTKNISTYAGTINNPGAPGAANGDGGLATSAQISAPNGLAVDSSGDLLITDSGNPKIRIVNAKTQIITSIAGTGFICGNAAERACGDGGPAATASFDFPRGVSVDSNSNIVVADTNNMRVRVISAGANPAINALAGGGSEGDGAAATSAILGVAQILTVDAKENIFALETDGERLREIDSKGTITTFAGLGVGGSTVGTNINGDNGPATNARFVSPFGVTTDSNGNFYIVDKTAAVVRKIDTSVPPVITTIAGNGMPCGAPGNPNTFPTCGGENVSATSASLAFPSGVAVDLAGNVYISDVQLNTIRVVSGGNIRTFAGTPGQSCNTFPTNCGDGGSPTSALLNTPFGVATASSVLFQGATDVFIADSGDNVIRKIDGESGTISTVAFNGNPGFGGDGGSATEAEMNFPEQIAVDSAENLYIGGGNDNLVRRVDQQDQTVITVAGDVNNLGGGFSATDDGGPSVGAMLSNFGLAVFKTPQGTHDLFIADSGNNRIRKVNLAPVSAVQPASGTTLTFPTTLDGQASVAQFISLQNSGLDDLILSNVQVSNGNFTLTDNCTQGAAPGSGCSMTLTFTPAAGIAGTITGTLTFTTNDLPNQNFSFNLTGTASNTPVTLTVNENPSSEGFVFSVPSGISCTTTNCTGTFAAGTTVTLIASGNSGFVFTSWNVGNAPDASKCASDTTGVCSFTITLSETIGVNFGTAPPPPPPGNFILTVNPIGNGSGTITSTPAGISCTYAGSGSPTGTCSFSFPVATTPSVTLTPATTGTVSGSVFAGWLGSLCNASAVGPCTINTFTTNFSVGPVFSGPVQPFAKGQVFLSTDDGMIFVYTSSGTLVQVLNSGNIGGNIEGMAFDGTGNLYAANPFTTAVAGSSGIVEFFGNTGAGPTTFGTGFNTPTSVVVDSSNNVYVGQAITQGDKLLQFSGGTGKQTSAFFPAYESDFSGIDWIDLRSDGDTLIYTLGTKTVRTFDLGEQVQHPDLVTNLHGAFALRALPDQTVLVADTDRIARLNVNGNVIQTYTIPGTSADFSNLNLDPDGVTFWTNDELTGTVYRLNIASGAIASQFPTNLGFTSLVGTAGIGGIAVSGEPQAGTGADLGISMTSAPNPVNTGSNLTYSITVTNNGPDSAQAVTVTDALPSGSVTFVSSKTSVGSCSGTTTVTCSLGAFANAATATITIVVTPTAAGMLTNTVNVTSTTPDPITSNNTATTSTTVGGSPATHFSVTGPTVATAGIAFNIIVTALDATNATATGYAGTVHFTSSDGNAVLPANSTLTNGVGTFLATLNTVGNQTITATDTVTASITGASGTITVTTTPGFGFSSTALPAGAVTVPYGADIQVTGGIPPYTFALANGSSLPAGFTLVPTASGTVAAGHVFNNSPAATGNFTFGITVTDSTPAAPQMATATISLTINAAPPNTQASLLQGRYGMLSRKVGDSSTSLSDVAGSINFDGSGSFTLSFDQNSEGGNFGTQCTASGTYSVGPDFRGVLTITTAGACATGSLGGGGNLPVITFALGDVYRGVANTGRFVQFNDNDGNSGLAAGIFRRQDQNAFTLTSLAGTYVLGLTGQDTNLGREVTLALAALNNSNMITAGTFDSNDNGTVTSGTFTGTYTTPDANGRSVLTLNTTPPGTDNIAMYIVSANQAFFLSLDPTTTNSLLAGEGDRQLNPNSFGLTSLQGPDILTLSGTSSGGTSAGVGLLTATVVNNVGNFSLTADIDDGGNLKLGQTGNGTYTAASNGRALVIGTSTGGTINLIAYLIGPDRAFFIGKDSSDPPFGEIEPQGGAPFSASPFANNLFIGQAEMVPNQNSEFSGIAVLGTTGTLNISDDESHNGGDLFFDQSLGTLTFTVFSASGHFTGQTSDGSQISGYVVSPFEAAIIDTTGPTTDSAPSVHPHLIIAQSIPAPPGTPSPATTSINFPTPVAIGSNAQSAPITITNTGFGPLGFTGQNVSNSPDFSASGTCLAAALVVIQPQGTCTLIVTFAPTASTATGVVLMETLTVTTDGGNITIAASGTTAAAVSGPTLKSIAVTPANPTEPVNSTLQFTATGTFSDNSTKDITSTVAWASSNTQAATISAGGLATTGATTALTTTISATLDNVTGSTVLTVSNSPISISVTPPPGGAFPPVPPGGRLAIGIVLTSIPGFSGTVTFSCTTSSPTITCAPDPASVTLTPGGPTDVAIVLNTFCTGTTTAALVSRPGGFGGGLALLLLSLALGGFVWTHRQSPRWALSFAVLVLMAIGGAACSSLPKGANGATPPGNYSVTFSATVNGVTTTTPPIPFTVK